MAERLESRSIGEQHCCDLPLESNGPRRRCPGWAHSGWEQPRPGKSAVLVKAPLEKGFAGVIKDTALVLTPPKEGFERDQKEWVLVKEPLEETQLDSNPEPDWVGRPLSSVRGGPPDKAASTT